MELDEIVAKVRESHSSELADEIETWRCPICGEHIASVTQECSATYIHGKTEAARFSLAHGIDPGPPQTEIRPVAYDTLFGCVNGHTTYVRTESVTKA